jgi:predicted enzyme related to lactoylglutathione lyase
MSTPENIEFLSAVLLTSRDPDRLAAFYRDVLGIALRAEQHDSEPAHWACELGDVHFAIHPAGDDVTDTPPGDGRSPVHLAFWVFDLETFARRLDADHGIGLRYPIQSLGAGSLVTAIADPDGNEVELTQMGRSWIEHLTERRRSGADVLTRSGSDGAVR